MTDKCEHCNGTGVKAKSQNRFHGFCDLCQTPFWQTMVSLTESRYENCYCGENVQNGLKFEFSPNGDQIVRRTRHE